MIGTIDDYPGLDDGPKPALLVLGATGCLGGALVASALGAGRSVIAIGRDADALDQLQASHAGKPLTTLAASVASDAEAAGLAHRVRTFGMPITGVVAAIRGTPVRGRLLDQPGEVLRRCIDDDLLPHLFAARHLLPMLSAHGQGGYVLVGGPGADYPWAGYGHHSITAAALRMLARVLHDEARTLGVHVQLLGVDAPLRTPGNVRHACPEWPSLGAVARRAVSMAIAPAASTDAVIRFGATDAPSPFWSDDIDAIDTAPTNTTATTWQESDGAMPVPAERSLHDGRRLLRDIASTPLIKDRLSP
ncbi:MAG: SDR family oxidoreductase [Xanthomonadaceae bacterium]|nr:SDR family oxidoreductase [Xanthomonadaceae bacterium]